MTNTKDSTVNLSYLYPKLLVMPSERYEKFYRERYEAQKNIKNVRSYGDLFPLNPNFGITEKQKIMMRKLSEGEIAGLIIFGMFITFLVLVPIQYGMKLTESLALNAVLLYGLCFIETLSAMYNEQNNERTFASVLSPVSAIVGITLLIAANVLASL